jgi:hypothetical protein
MPNLFDSLKENAIDSMMVYLEDRDNNFDSEEEFDKWAEEFVNSDSRWWDFSETDLNSNNFNNLLLINAKCMEEFQVTEIPDDITTLLRRYGAWYVLTEERDMFYELWLESAKPEEESEE